MAHKKGLGSSRNGRDSNPKMLGVKKFAGEAIRTGQIIARQRGTKLLPGAHVGVGRDHTLFALMDGTLVFEQVRGRKRVRVSPGGLGQSDSVCETGAMASFARAWVLGVAATLTLTLSLKGEGKEVATRFGRSC